MGETQSGTQRLWNDGVTDRAANDNEAQGRLQAELGYGFGVFGGTGVLTPYSGLSLAGEGAGRYTLGSRLEIGSSLHLNWRMTFLFVAAQRRHLDLPVGLTDLRHSFASGAVALGESLPMIGKLLGHIQVQTTARYAHLAADPVKAAAERVTSNIASILGSGQDRDTDAAVI